eukprot:CAMPEP_0171637324 /NCGR_PEP_ID=MMETSP0990-20121206/28107_1 /TAXON_ID=483369 /ORGANISM="non described non described, Strain CCMP2098" /LENGTH=249 /DNA_ID=CAMNT_0012209963 /DNA_START=46 /DNA_END=797 /DNA_ORIENTATION=-
MQQKSISHINRANTNAHHAFIVKQGDKTGRSLTPLPLSSQLRQHRLKVGLHKEAPHVRAKVQLELEAAVSAAASNHSASPGSSKDKALKAALEAAEASEEVAERCVCSAPSSQGKESGLGLPAGDPKRCSRASSEYELRTSTSSGQRHDEDTDGGDEEEGDDEGNDADADDEAGDEGQSQFVHARSPLPSLPPPPSSSFGKSSPKKAGRNTDSAALKRRFVINSSPCAPGGGNGSAPPSPFELRIHALK